MVSFRRKSRIGISLADVWFKGREGKGEGEILIKYFIERRGEKIISFLFSS